MLRNVLDVLRNVPAMLRNVTGVLRNVPCLLRNVLGALLNDLGVCRNVLGVLRNVPGVLRNVSFCQHTQTTTEVYGKSALAPMNKFTCKLHGYIVYFSFSLPGKAIYILEDYINHVIINRFMYPFLKSVQF